MATKTSILLPRIHGYELENHNNFGAPYMLMDEVLGKFIRPLPSTPIDEVPHIYSQTADVVLALSRLTFPKIGLLSSGDANNGLPFIKMGKSIRISLVSLERWLADHEQQIA